eukprot:scaffold421184_cov56-Attheya_sp.AAC.11
MMRRNEPQSESSMMMPFTCLYKLPVIAFAIVSFSLGELGDGLNVGIGWNEGSIGIALSLMGLTALLCQTMAGDIVDKTTFDRRYFLVAASIFTAVSASTVLLVREGNVDHMLIYISKVIEGIASSFIGPCLAALTMACFGPDQFDAVMASNILWGHIGSVLAAVLAGGTAYILYPNIKYCFLVIGFSALVAVLFIGYLPQGDTLMGRGFKHIKTEEEENKEQPVENLNVESTSSNSATPSSQEAARFSLMNSASTAIPDMPEAASYRDVFFEQNTFANANVLLVLGELMGGENDDGSVKQSAIPLIAGAIVTAQITMAAATLGGDFLTARGMGRKPIFLAGLLTLPMRCALIIYWKDAGEAYLLSTQVFDGLGGGFFGLLHPYLVADITFGTGRFNVVMGLTASCFGLGSTLSNFFGQMVVEKLGHVASLSGSLLLSFIPIAIFAMFMAETKGHRGETGDAIVQKHALEEKMKYVEMA